MRSPRDRLFLDGVEVEGKELPVELRRQSMLVHLRLPAKLFALEAMLTGYGTALLPEDLSAPMSWEPRDRSVWRSADCAVQVVVERQEPRAQVRWISLYI